LENPPLAKFEDEKVQKRNRPVTQPIQASGSSDDDEEAGGQEIDPEVIVVDDALSKDPNGMSRLYGPYAQDNS